MEYHFIFVRSDGKQSQKITEIVVNENITPKIDSHKFNLDQVNEAIAFLKNGHPNGKVIISLDY